MKIKTTKEVSIWIARGMSDVRGPHNIDANVKPTPSATKT